MPSACAAMPMRPPSSARIAILKPSPRPRPAARRPAAARRRGRSATTARRGCPACRRAGRSSGRGCRSAPEERRDALGALALGRSWRSSSTTSATGPLVMKFLVPFSTQPLAVAHGRGLLRGGVRAGLRLGQREAAELLARRPGRAASASSARRCRSAGSDRRPASSAPT